MGMVKESAVKVYMPVGLHKRLQIEATLRDTSLSALIRHACHKELRESEETRSRLHRELAGQTALEFK